MDAIKDLLKDTPELALFVCLAIGYAIGKIKIWKLSLGGVAGSLIAAIFIGMWAEVALNDQVKNIAFALFIFTLGYISGPTFFASLNRKSLRYGTFTLIEVSALLVITAAAIVIMGLDPGTAAGLMGGGATESAVVGTATDAIARLPLSDDAIKTLQGNVGTAYSISYICGLITIVIMSSQIFPIIMRINLRDEAAKLWEKMGGGSTDDETSVAAMPGVVGRAYHVDGSAGRTVSDIEAGLGNGAAVERIRRGDDFVTVGPDVVTQRDDVMVIVGQRDALTNADTVVGPEVPANHLINFELDIADVVLTAKGYEASKLSELRTQVPATERHGVFLTGVTRMDHQLPMQADTVVQKGDTLRFTGTKSDVAKFVPQVGFRIDKSIKADFVFISLGVAAGFLVGKIVVTAGNIPLTLGTGGGCLLTGLAFGWVRARFPEIGQYHPAAAEVIKTLGLSAFIVAVGLSSGPQAVKLVEKFGFGLPITGVLMTLIPASISLFVAWKVMKLPAPLTLGAVTGQQCSTPGVTAVQQAAGNSTPLMSYTVVYALSNIALPLMGPVVVAMAHAMN